MGNIASMRIQVFSIIISVLFLIYVSRLIIKGKLREEFAIFWVASTLMLVVFSFWRDGLEVIAKLMGVFDAPNLVFMGAILAILVYLLHLSTVVSKLHDQNKELTQELAILRNLFEKKIENTDFKEKED